MDWTLITPIHGLATGSMHAAVVNIVAMDAGAR